MAVGSMANSSMGAKSISNRSMSDSSVNKFFEFHNGTKFRNMSAAFGAPPYELEYVVVA